MNPAHQVRTVGELLAFLNAGERPNYLFFWGHRKEKGGTVGPSCMSQWFPQSFAVNGLIYPTAEHYMMAGKARLFHDDAVLADILVSTDPSKAKALGRKVKGYDESLWVTHRFAIVVAGNYAKFSQHEGLKAFLLSTGDKVLVEASPVDQIWGIGLARDDANATHPDKWKGLNLLGFALMEVRDMLRNLT